MEVEDKLEPFNPWNVEDIDQFLNYCCPECDTKQKTKSKFIVHAIYVHPKSRNYLPLIKFEEEKDNEQIIDPKGETNVSNLEFIEDIYEDHKLIIKPSEDNFIECADCCESFENNVDYNSHYYAVHVKGKTQDPLATKIIQPTKRKAIEPLLEILENDLNKKKVNNVQCIDCQNVFHPSLLEKHKKVCPNQKHDIVTNSIPSASGLQKKNQTSKNNSESAIDRTDLPSSKNSQDHLDLITEKDPLDDTNLSDLEFKEEMIEDHEFSPEPSKKKLRNECEVAPEIKLKAECKCRKYIWNGKEVKGKHCKLCSSSQHPSGFAKHVKNCKGTWKCPCCSQMIDSTSYFINEVHSKCRFIIPYNHCSDCHKIIRTNNKVNIVRNCTNEESIDEVDIDTLPEDEDVPKEPKSVGADGIQKYKCDECPMFFNSVKRLKKHKRNNHSNGQENQKCFLCDLAFPSKLMGRHLIRKHLNANGVFECDLCSEVFKKSNYEQFMYHLTEEHQIGEFRHKCDQCYKVFQSKDYLRQHKKIHTNLPVICDKCGKELSSQQKLRDHLKLVHNLYDIQKEDTIKKCDKCDMEFEKPEEFNDHLKNCLDELKDIACNLCDSRWVSHLSLWQHIAVDHELIRHICDICGSVLTSSDGLRKHQNIVHKKIYKLVCHLCAKQLSSNSYLKSHMISVHGIGEEQKFKCDQCDKSFCQKGHLKVHIATVHENVRFHCDKCDKSFSQKDKLTLHMRSVHENIRFYCDKCEKNFSSKHCLYQHVKMVHENVRYNCHKCEKSYSAKQNLNDHIQSKHGSLQEKVCYKCQDCEKNFSTKTNLDRHIQIFHKVLPNATKTLYQCEQCPKTFMVKYYLKNHVRMVHDKIKPNKCDLCEEAYFAERDLIKHRANVHHV